MNNQEGSVSPPWLPCARLAVPGLPRGLPQPSPGGRAVPRPLLRAAGTLLIRLMKPRHFSVGKVPVPSAPQPPRHPQFSTGTPGPAHPGPGTLGQSLSAMAVNELFRLACGDGAGMGSGPPRAIPAVAPEQPHARGQAARWHGRAVGLLPLLRARSDPPHSGPAAASPGETEAPPSCGCCASLLAPAAPSFPARPWWRFWEWHRATWRWRVQLDTSSWGVPGREPPPAVPATGSPGWARCGAGVPRASRALPEVTRAPRFSRLGQGREHSHPIPSPPPIPSRPIPPIPGASSPCQPRSPGDGPSVDSRLPGRNVLGGSGPPPAGAASSFSAI